jgi:hypothetical protein
MQPPARAQHHGLSTQLAAFAADLLGLEQKWLPANIDVARRPASSAAVPPLGWSSQREYGQLPSTAGWPPLELIFLVVISFDSDLNRPMEQFLIHLWCYQ